MLPEKRFTAIYVTDRAKHRVGILHFALSGNSEKNEPFNFSIQFSVLMIRFEVESALTTTFQECCRNCFVPNSCSICS